MLTRDRNSPVASTLSLQFTVCKLEVSLWCLLTTNSDSEAVLKAINLNDDTDTIDAVTKGLAGIYYGIEAIPQTWLDTLARRYQYFNC